MMKSCLQLLLLFYLNFSFNIASEDDNLKTSETNFDHGFGEWQVANHSWVIDKWEDIKKKSNQSFQDPTTSNKSVSKVNPSILIHPSFQPHVKLTFRSTYTCLYILIYFATIAVVSWLTTTGQLFHLILLEITFTVQTAAKSLFLIKNPYKDVVVILSWNKFGSFLNFTPEWSEDFCNSSTYIFTKYKII